ncbi:hypothetical protein PO124_33905 [Bacillus licheniformis]|nr:hypothetical protein [Bacillus licheniformis]
MNKLQKKTGMICPQEPRLILADGTIIRDERYDDPKAELPAGDGPGAHEWYEFRLRFRKPSLHRLRVNGIHAPGTKGSTSLKRRMAKKGSSAG